jgi:hypothetical protein
MSYAIGNNVTYGLWSAVIDEVVVPDHEYLIRFDGCVTPANTKQQWPHRREFLAVYQTELLPRVPRAEDDDNRKAWLTRWVPPSVSPRLHANMDRVVCGQTVSWAVQVKDHKMNHTYLNEYSGVIKAIQQVGIGFVLIYTGIPDSPTRMVAASWLDV